MVHVYNVHLHVGGDFWRVGHSHDRIAGGEGGRRG